MSDLQIRYTDDADAYTDWIVGPKVVQPDSPDITFTPTIAVKDGDYTVTGVWQSDVGPSRTLRVPVAGLPVGSHRLYLQVPGGNDLSIGTVHMVARS